MKNILIPTDFSENAWNATQYALEYFKDYDTHFILAHIEHRDIMPPAFDTLHSYITGEMLEANKVNMMLASTKEAMMDTGLVTSSQIILDHLEINFIKGLKQLIERYTIDLMVMGTQGLSADKNKIIGKHAQEVITKIKCPVLVIPKKAIFSVPVNIAFPTDYDFLYKNKILDTLTSLADFHNSSIKVIRIVNPKMPISQFQHKNREYLKDFFKNSTSSFHRVNHPNFQEGLQDFIDSMHIDMIAVIAKNLNFFQMLLFKPTVVKMSYHTEIPFLVLHE